MYKHLITPEPSPVNTLVVLRNTSNKYGTFGELWHNGHIICDTLEPVKCDNKRNSAVKDGTISPLFITDSPKFGCKLPIFFALGRSGLRIHGGNCVSDTHGCVLVGTATPTGLVCSSVALKRVIRYILDNSLKYIKFSRTC